MNKSNSSADNTPLLKALRQLAHKLHSPFYAPGHKQGRGMNPQMKDLVEKLGVKADLPELPELDNLFAPTNLIKLAQDLAAETFGAEHTWFLVNGSTCGIIASILATCQPGDKIILPRNIHQSAIAGLILAGARPIFLQPAYDSDLDLVGSLTPQVIEQALQQHPESKAVLLLYPTYQGVGGEIATIAKLVHRYNIPILVDEAHGAHFSFHPNLPISALAAGADVAVQSTHKTLSSLTQASMLHLQGKLVSANKISQALQLLESTSPNYLLLASLDAAREQMAVSGQKLMSQTLELAAIARQELNKLEVISVLELPQPLTPGFASLDSTRLTLDVRKLGLSGFAVDDILHQKLGVTAELPLPQQLTFMITLGNTLDDIRQLIKACQSLAKDYRQKIPEKTVNLPYFSESIQIISEIIPRQAFFSPSKMVTAKKAIGELSAELICPYPPGIPVLMPGEKITGEAFTYLKQLQTAGAMITGASDFQLNYLKVLELE